MVIVLFVIIPILLWLISITLLLIWDDLLKFILWNILIIAIYITINIYGKSIFWEHDEYGLAVFFRIQFFLSLHTLLVFIFAIYKNYKLRHHERST